ncbi:hypothetical protein P168DRAFT_300716 [Aspergillus campestris IBT 28561]|uniref:Uncharacterized protein n=1 Tax=Aspergillus campestris (strain IBT 28561) TaxID=1392248 RepID=A0A2I1DDG1_ASPC2|nr:uncharacterized protein P168DRAFT_300716 [Aspergillus campestris IBT 28561]PKY07919.1 hypothetical protein P168DRAFT_300716 [Aspergillus campestris IBT 28561]
MKDDPDDQTSEDEEDSTSTATASPEGSLIADEEVPEGGDSAESPLPQSPSPQSPPPRNPHGGRESPDWKRPDSTDTHEDPSSDHDDAMAMEGDGPLPQSLSPRRPSEGRESPGWDPPDNTDTHEEPSNDKDDAKEMERDSPPSQSPSEGQDSPEWEPPNSTDTHDDQSSDHNDATEGEANSAEELTTPPKIDDQDPGHHWVHGSVTPLATGGLDHEKLPWGKNTVTSAKAGLSKVQSRRRDLNARFNVDMRADVSLEIHTQIQGDVVLGTFN